MLTFKFVYLQGHGAQYFRNVFPRRQTSKCKKSHMHFCASSIRFRDISVSNIWPSIFDLQNVGQGHEIKFSRWRHSMTNINVCKSRATHFCTFSPLLTFQIVDLQKGGQGHGVQFFSMTYVRTNVIFHFFFYFGLGTTCAHESYTQTQTRRRGETDRAMAIGEIADFPKNLLSLQIIIGI